MACRDPGSIQLRSSQRYPNEERHLKDTSITWKRNSSKLATSDKRSEWQCYSYASVV